MDEYVDHICLSEGAKKSKFHWPNSVLFGVKRPKQHNTRAVKPGRLSVRMAFLTCRQARLYAQVITTFGEQCGDKAIKLIFLSTKTRIYSSQIRWLCIWYKVKFVALQFPWPFRNRFITQPCKTARLILTWISLQVGIKDLTRITFISVIRHAF